MVTDTALTPKLMIVLFFLIQTFKEHLPFATVVLGTSFLGCLILASSADLLRGPSWAYGQPSGQVVAG